MSRNSSRPDWALILHAGASSIAKPDDGRVRAVCLKALAVGQDILQRGGSAVDAVAETMMELENDPVCNAGYGAVLNADGAVELDAAIMDGATLDIGAIAAAKGIRHPADVARRLLREKPILLAGEGARRWAAAHGAEMCDERDFDRIRNPKPKSKPMEIADTVGAVALDRAGNFAAGTSTGGLSGKPPGRVGDSPLPGGGFLAENGIGGASLSGIGERIARLLSASRILRSLETVDAQAAADDAVGRAARLGGDVGAIVLDAEGRIGWAHDTPQFGVAYATSALAPAAFLSRTQDSQAR